jgi:hypothetical protein
LECFLRCIFPCGRLCFFITFYCPFQRCWQSGLSSYSEARGGPICLKFWHSNLALISIHFWWLEKFSDHRRFFESGKKKKWGDFSEFFRCGQLERIFLCYVSYRKNPFVHFVIGRIVNFHFRPILEFSDSWFWRYKRFKKHRLFFEISQSQKLKFRKSVQIIAKDYNRILQEPFST